MSGSPSPRGLVDHAQRLATPTAGAPTEEDLRRATSAAYYALFHTVAGAVADQFFWQGNTTHSDYERFYRNPKHRDILDRCKRYDTLCTKTGAPNDPDLNRFALAFRELYAKREEADYKPDVVIALGDVHRCIRTASNAIDDFERCDPVARKAFLSLIVFPPRSDM